MSTLNRCVLVSYAPIALVQKYWGLQKKIVFVIIQISAKPHIHFYGSWGGVSRDLFIVLFFSHHYFIGRKIIKSKSDILLI